MEQKVTSFGPFSLSDVKQAFAAFDLDKNSFVGAAELRAVYSALGEEVTDDEIDEMIRMVDTDGDGQVSEGEFAKMIFRYAQQIPDKHTEQTRALPPAAGATAGPGAGAGTGTGTGAGVGEDRKSARRKPKSRAASPGASPRHDAAGAGTGAATGAVTGVVTGPSGVASPTNAGSAGAAGGGGGGQFALTAAKLQEKKGDLRSVLTGLNINTEQIKKLMTQFQQIGAKQQLEGAASPVPPTPAHAAAAGAAAGDAKAGSAGAGTGAGDTKRTRYVLNYLQFCRVLGLETSAMAERLFALFDHDRSGQIDAKEFLIGLSSYADSTQNDKLRFAFSLYDEDGSGKISMTELLKIMQAINMTSNAKHVQKKAEQIMAHGDKDRDGTLSFDEFVACAKAFPSLLFPVMSVTKKVDSAIF